MSKRTYKIFGICFYLLLIIVAGLCTGAKLYRFYFSSPAVEDLDMSGYDILNVNRIKGNNAPVLFGLEDTSHSLSDPGDIVCKNFEVNGNAWFDAGFSVLLNTPITWGGNDDKSIKVDNSHVMYLSTYADIIFKGWSGAVYEEKMRLQATTGNLGIGDNNPSVKLDVTGSGHFTGDLTVDGEIIGGTKSYTEMYRCCYNSVTTIDTADFWHMVSTTTVGLLNNWTHEVGDTAAITAYADGGGGLVTVTSAGHGMSAGNMISITGSTNYNALEEVVGVHTDTFTVTAAWAGDDGAGTWIKGDSLTAGANSAGVYSVNFTATLTPAVNNEIFSFAFSKNAVECEKCRVRNKMGIVGDYKPEPGTALISIAEGDVLNFIVKNVGANGNVTIRHGNINLHRL